MISFSSKSFATALFGVMLVFNLQAAGSTGTAALRLPAIFGDNMVLQQQQAVPVWGWAVPGAKITVHFAGQNKSTHADADGKWFVKLDKLKASSAPRKMLVTSFWGLTGNDSPSNEVGSGEMKTFTNILVGEVWLCSGQSNMEKPIGKQPGQKPCFNYEQELAAANFPNIRIFKIEKVLSATPLADVNEFKPWQECNSNSLNTISFSAAAYFFGREIHTNLNVPVGLIESSWGGTKIEPWTSPAGFKSVPSLAALASPVAYTNKIPNTDPMVIYNAMIAPIAGFSMRGALWYQGESNCMSTNNPDGAIYIDKMAALVGGWRKIWGEGDFPFYYVEIAPFKYFGGKIRRVPSPETLPEFWEAQAHAQRIKNTGMAVTTDLVDNLDDIHPRNKQDVGHRLALLALDQTYDKEVVSAGPEFKTMKISGNNVVLKFANTDGGLVSKGGQLLTWFTIAGADGKFVPADAKIAGDVVEVSAVGIDQPVAVRFAWDEIAQPNLFNKAGLPAEPFRTDDPITN